MKEGLKKIWIFFRQLKHTLTEDTVRDCQIKNQDRVL